MDESRIRIIVDQILSHGEPLGWVGPVQEVQEKLDALAEVGEPAALLITNGILGYAEGLVSAPYWWDSARELCKLLARSGGASAGPALLRVLETESRIVEFDSVRATAALQLVTLGDSSLVPRLAAASKRPNAPILAIHVAITALGGKDPPTPEVIIEVGRTIDDPEAAAQYFSEHQSEISGWSHERKGAFWFFFGRKVARVVGNDAALPYYAAALVANPGPNMASWLEFGAVSKTPETARKLAITYPLPSEWRPSSSNEASSGARVEAPRDTDASPTSARREVMNFLSRVLGRKPRATDDTTYQDGDQIPCGACGQQLKVKYFPSGGKVVTGGPEEMRGIALRCQQCDFIMCIHCAMKSMGGLVQACPSCKKLLGPTVLTQGSDVLKQPRSSVTRPGS